MAHKKNSVSIVVAFVRAIITLFLYTFPCIATANFTFIDGIPMVFSGTYGPSRIIEMTLVKEGHELSGSYIHDSDQTPTQIRGKIDSEGSISLLEEANGSIYGSFRGRFVANRFEGEWESVGAELPFTFSMLPIAAQSETNTSTTLATTVDSKKGSSSVVGHEKNQSTGSYVTPTTGSSSQTKSTPSGNSTANWPNFEYVLIAWICIVIIGVLLGIKDVIVVFRNYNDLALVFATGIMIVAAVYAAMANENRESLFPAFFVVLAIILVVWVIFRTIRDNQNPLWMIIAFITKITLSVVFLINLINFVTPAGKTTRARAATRRSSFVALLLIAPITFALIKEKNGIFSPRAVLGGRF